MSDQPDQRRFGRNQYALKIGQFQFQRHSQHHQADGRIDDKQPLGVEIQTRLIDRCQVHERTFAYISILPVRAATQSHSPGGSMLATGSTSA